MDEKHLQEWLRKRKERRSTLSAESLCEGIFQQDVSSLSAAITLLESTRPSDQLLAKEIIKTCIPKSGKSIRIGITGVPGVGKSTFIEAFGKLVSKLGKRIAVLAIDPSSEISGGSILGDKTRMEELSHLENVFIRPTPSGHTLGGVAKKTRETILLCEAAGYDVILIETVGVGQSETMVHSMVDFFLLLMLAGAGDELQGIKRGIMEMADALIITKADGDNEMKAKLAAAEYQNALHLFPPKTSNWTAKAFTCSALSGRNLEKTWEIIESFVNLTHLNGSFIQNRQKQDDYWFEETLKELILDHVLSDTSLKLELQNYKQAISAGRITSFQAAEEIFNQYKRKHDGTGI